MEWIKVEKLCNHVTPPVLGSQTTSASLQLLEVFFGYLLSYLQGLYVCLTEKSRDQLTYAISSELAVPNL